MFEVVSTKRERRASLHRTATAIYSVAVHLAILTGVALLPRSPLRHARAPREVPVTYFDIPVLHTPTGNTRSGAPAGSTLPDPSRQAAKQLRDEFAALRQASVPNRVEQAVPRVAGAPGGGGIATDTVATTLLSSLAEAARTRASEAAKREPVDLSALSELPRLSNPRTMAGWWTELYPTRLLLRGIEGEAVVSFIIEMDGHVSSPKILSTTHPDFGRATLRGARLMRFRPALLGGQPVRVRATMPVQWVLPRV